MKKFDVFDLLFFAGMAALIYGVSLKYGLEMALIIGGGIFGATGFLLSLFVPTIRGGK